MPREQGMVPVQFWRQSAKFEILLSPAVSTPPIFTDLFKFPARDSVPGGPLQNSLDGPGSSPNSITSHPQGQAAYWKNPRLQNCVFFFPGRRTNLFFFFFFFLFFVFFFLFFFCAVQISARGRQPMERPALLAKAPNCAPPALGRSPRLGQQHENRAGR